MVSALRLRSELVPSRPFNHQTLIKSCSGCKPPLFPSYNRARAIRLCSIEYYRSYLQKQRNLGAFRRSLPPPIPDESQRHTSSERCQMKQARTGILTPTCAVSPVQPASLEKFFQKTRAVQSSCNVPSRTTNPETNRGSYLDSLMYKARVGPKTLMVQHKHDAGHNNARRTPLVSNYDRNGWKSSNSGNSSKIRAIAKGVDTTTSNGGKTAVLIRSDTDMRHTKISVTPRNTFNTSNSQSNRTTSQLPRLSSERNHSCRKDSTCHQRSPSVPFKTETASTSPRSRKRKPTTPVPEITRLPSPEARQQPKLNPRNRQCQIRRSEKSDHRLAYAAKPARSFPLPTKHLARQHEKNVPLSGGVRKPVRKSGARKKEVCQRNEQTALQKTSVQDLLDADKRAEALNVVQEAGVQKTSSARPIKKRRVGSFGQPDCRISGIVNTISMGKQHALRLDLTRLENSGKTKQLKTGQTESPSPACIREGNFDVRQSSSRKDSPAKNSFNHVRRGLMCERGRKRISKHPGWIADPLEEDKTRAALEAVRMRADEEALTPENKLPLNSDDWAIKFVPTN